MQLLDQIEHLLGLTGSGPVHSSRRPSGEAIARYEGFRRQDIQIAALQRPGEDRQRD